MLRLSVIGLLLIAAVGCARIDKDAIDKVATRHDDALKMADTAIVAADKSLAEIVTPPPQVESAREKLDDARQGIALAREASDDMKDMLVKQTEQKAKLEEAFFSPKQKRLATGIGIIVALVGLAVALIRFGGMGGLLASLPIIGGVVLKIQSLGKGKK